jgi:predicted pyridoxine 5'-phosphate oxidase superfamily flavin-nucleotide-binding protein
MRDVPEAVVEAWNNREGPAVFVTVGESGVPNAIYVTCIRRADGARFVIADNYFDKTRRNIDAGTRGALLFITKERKSFQVKGSLESHGRGEAFEGMKKWLDPKYPGRAAVVLNVDEAYRGAEKLA